MSYWNQDRSGIKYIMTLIAGISLGGMPAFIGDLLTSWKVPVESELPTRPEPAIQPGEDGYYAHSLAQKLVIVRPYFLLAWAGSQSNTLRILKEIDNLLPSTFDEIKEFAPILDVLSSCAQDSEMIALVIGDGMVQPICVGTRGVEIDGKRVYLMGSGAPEFFDYLSSDQITLPESGSSSMTACAMALRFAARAVAIQWVTGAGLETSWGGGFEVVYPEPDGFKKIDRILFRAWIINSDGNYIGSGRSFFVRYSGNDLYLSAFWSDEKTYIVPSPIGRSVSPPPFEVIQVAWTVDIFLHNPTGRLIEFVRFEPDTRRANDFIEISDGIMTGWSMDQSYVERCVRTALDQMENGDVFRVDKY